MKREPSIPVAARNIAGRVIRATAVCVLLLSGCMVGPKYQAPAVAAPPAYKESSPAAYSSALPGTWQPAQPQDAELKGKWWETFNEPELNALEDQLNINNQNIAQYFENFMAARAQVREAQAIYFPTVTTVPSYSRTRIPSTLGNGGAGAGTGGSSSGKAASTTTALALPFDVSWAPDLWGRIRSTVHEFQYAAQVSAADLENERLTEQAALAVYFFQLRGQDALQDLYNRTIEADRKALELTRVLVETGIDSPEAVAQAEVTLRNAEEVGKAGCYPTLNLTGSGGVQSSGISMLFSAPTMFWSLGASASQTIFDAGLRRATVAQYTATYNADVAAYKQT